MSYGPVQPVAASEPCPDRLAILALPTRLSVWRPSGECRLIHDRIHPRHDAEQLRRISEATIAHYDRLAEAYWDGTRDHDVNQNHAALLDAIEGDPPYSILDLGCGPGRDLRYFRSLGHDVVGLDGSTEFLARARSYSECEFLQQDFLAMELPQSRFDSIFANASLFHVPSQELPRVLAELSETLRSRGVLFCSNPRGKNEEGFSGDRYCCFFDHDTWRDYVTAAGFMPPPPTSSSRGFDAGSSVEDGVIES
jgi:SAM-dependent methyltransferase